MEAEFEVIESLISEHLLVETSSGSSEEKAFLEMIAKRVEELLESNMELFLNHLYRMDVSEKKVALALAGTEGEPENVYMALARLILARQKERLETRQKYRQESSDFWAE